MEPKTQQPKWVHPAWSRRPVWTLKRKLMGNLIPGLFAVAPLTYGLYLMWHTGEMLGKGLLWLGVALVSGWLAVDFFGLFQNRAMRKEMTMRLRYERSNPPYQRYFVGMATPVFRGVLDPHEDVGFLLLHPDKIEFFGERLRVEIARDEVVGVRARPNVHTFIGLGRWVSIEAKTGSRDARLLVELRQRPTLLANLIMSRTLIKKLNRWIKGSKPTDAGNR